MEAGMGVAAIALPDYRASDRTRTFALPAPYFVYRGDFFKADRFGLRGIFVRTDRIDLDLSVGASLPVDGDQTSAREGMPDLAPPSSSAPRST